MRLKSEDEILKPEIRRQIIEEIDGPENMRRKHAAYRAHMSYKDQTSTFVIDQLLRQFDSSTVSEMSYAIANISIIRKIINKLARVYSHGVNRTVTDDDGSTEKVEEIDNALNVTQTQKTLNRFLKLHHNTTNYLKPCKSIEDDDEVFRVRPTPLAPYLYDVIEDFYDRTRPMVHILSNYRPDHHSNMYSLDPAREGRRSELTDQKVFKGDFTDQKIADVKEDQDNEEDNRRFIWWTNKYHFTTNAKGVAVDEDGNELKLETDMERFLNPIEESPFVDYHLDQEDAFWAEGGRDLVDMGIIINSLMSLINHIGVTQGYGQFWMRGKDLPRNIVVGPTKAVVLEMTEDDPTPEIGFASANPPLAELMSLVENQVAMTLTTNNLSTAGVKTTLSGGSDFPSGIAMLIDKSESMEDVSDQRALFQEKEQDTFRIISKWHEFFQGENQIDEEFRDMILPEDFELSVEFGQPQPIISESEKLDVIQKKKDLGVATMVDLIKELYPGLTDEQAQEKLDQINKEKQDRMEAFTQPPMEQEEIEEESDGGDEETDSNEDEDDQRD